MNNKVLKLKQALNSMLVATDTSVELPEGHPGHEAYLNIVARPRAVAALLEFEESAPSAASNTGSLQFPSLKEVREAYEKHMQQYTFSKEKNHIGVIEFVREYIITTCKQQAGA